MPFTDRLVRPAAAWLLILSACGERAPQGAEQPADGDTIVQLEDTQGPAAQAVVQDTSRWLQAEGVVHELRPDAGPAVLGSVGATGHAGFDRVTFVFSTGRVPGYHVEYTEEPIRECGSGREVEIAGGGRLLVRLEPAQAHDDQGRVTVQDRARTLELAAFQEMTLTCDFEGQVQWVFGVPSPTPFRVTELADPSRLVVDVRHER